MQFSRANKTVIGASALVWIALCSGRLLGQQPNIVFIVVDDAGYEDFGFMGSTEIPTPNLDALAASGVKFTQAHTGQACSPSRAAFLTGVGYNRWGYEANLKNTSNPTTQHFEGLPNSAVTMFERLKGLGYSTSVAGKWHVGGLDDVVEGGAITVPGNKPPKQGVDHFIGFQAGGGLQEMFLNSDGTNNVSSYDSRGQYWSDLWGDLTVDYIDHHYQDSDPFFIYTSFNDPHSPIQQAPSFNDPLIAHLSGQRKRYASEILTIDYNVGKIVEKLSDPDGNPSTPDSILEETMIVFLNDNGGAGQNSASNGTLRDGKGSPYDGGTRVPMFITGAGIAPNAAGTAYGKMVHSMDIVPTMVAAGGGTIPSDEVDGVNLLPFANGLDSSNPHAFLAQRLQEETFYRLNDWKLVKNGYAGDWELYDFSDVNDQSESPSDNVAAADPEQVVLMQRLLTDWEVTIDKQRFPSTDESIGQFNLFDHFTFAQTDSSFSATNGWVSPNGTPATMRDRDSHNGTVFHFGVSNSANYTATNDLRRMNELEFVAHGIELEGNFTSAVDRQATINGLPVLLAKNFASQLPSLKLSASSSGGNTFSFDVDMHLQLYDDLEITGDGTQSFSINGGITEYTAGRKITKTGSSTVTFTSDVEATGGGYRAEAGTTLFRDSSTLVGDLVISSGSTVAHDGTIAGQVTNSGTLIVSDTQAGRSTVLVNLLPTLGDGDIDSRNAGTRGDQDGQILVGAVSNATGATVERVQRALFSFDLSSIPDDVTVADVSMNLQFDGNDPSSSNNISGDLELYALQEDPLFQETGAENVDWNRRDAAGGLNWSTPGGTLGALVAHVLNNDLPNPQTTTQGDSFQLTSLAAFAATVNESLLDDSVSFVLLLPGEETDAAAMIGDRNLYRFGSNESNGASPARLSFSYEVVTDSIAHISGDFTQEGDGLLLFDLRSSSDFDQLVVGGDFNAGGTLAVYLWEGYSPELGDVFDILDFDPDRVSGAFDAFDLPVLEGGLDWDTSSLLTTGELAVVAESSVVLLGDFNGDGVVDSSDYAVWRDNLGAADESAIQFNGDGVGGVAAGDYQLWRNHYGDTLQFARAASFVSVAVPEPACLLGLLVFTIAGSIDLRMLVIP